VSLTGPSKKPKLQGVGNEEEMRDAERSPEPDTEQYLEQEQYLELEQFVDQDVSTQHSENLEYNEQDDMTGADEVSRMLQNFGVRPTEKEH
jgi:hypothetical protein